MKKILIVEDSSSMRQFLRTLFQKNGFEVIGEAENGKDAVEKYKELNPDIVTLDLDLPQVDGWHVFKAIKKINPNAITVIITSVDCSTSIRKASELGVNGYLLKSFSKDRIIQGMKML